MHSQNVFYHDIKLKNSPPRYTNLIENFDGTSIDTSKWDQIRPNGVNAFIVNNGILNVGLTVGSSASYGYTTVLLRSKDVFPVGTRYRVRARNSSGNAAALIGFSNNNTTVGIRSDGEIGCSWYSRNDYGTTAYDNIYPSLTDENGQKFYQIDESGPIDTYSILEIRRVSETILEFYKDDVLVKTVSNYMFADDYSVFVGLSNNTSKNSSITMDVDWIEVIAP